jgi:hypothetical protein
MRSAIPTLRRNPEKEVIEVAKIVTDDISPPPQIHEIVGLTSH